MLVLTTLKLYYENATNLQIISALQDLYRLHTETFCDTHDLLECNCTNEQVSNTTSNATVIFIFFSSVREVVHQFQWNRGYVPCCPYWSIICGEFLWTLQVIAMGELLDWKHYFKPIRESDLMVTCNDCMFHLGLCGLMLNQAWKWAYLFYDC